MTDLTGKKKTSIGVWIIFCVFFIVLLLEHRFVYLYLDDFGYGSLSFTNTIDGVNGTNYTLSQFLEFYSQHYMTISGRIVFLGLETLLLQSGVWLIRVVQCAIITGILFSIYKIISRESKAKPFMIALIVISLYGLLEIFMLDKSIYWFTGSAMYLWPMLPLLVGCYLYYLYACRGNEKFSAGKKAAMIVCIALAALAQEQLSAAEIVIILLIFLAKKRSKQKFTKIDIIVILVAIAGFLFIYLSPGARARVELLQYEAAYTEFSTLPLPGKIKEAYLYIILHLFSKNFYLIILAMLSAGVFSGIMLLRKKLGIRILNILMLAFDVLCIAYMLVSQDGIYTNLSMTAIPTGAAVAGLTLVLLFWVYGFTAYYLANKKKFILMLFYAGLISLFCLVVVLPPQSGRFYIPFVFPAIVVMGDIFCDLITTANKKWAAWLVLGVLAACASYNMTSQTLKYAEVCNVQEYNQQMIDQTLQNLKAGENVKEITLKYYPNIESNLALPPEGDLTIYQDRTIEDIKQYYGLPLDLVINWVP